MYKSGLNRRSKLWQETSEQETNKNINQHNIRKSEPNRINNHRQETSDQETPNSIS